MRPRLDQLRYFGVAFADARIPATDASTVAAYGFRSHTTALRERVIVIHQSMLVISVGLSPP